MNVGTEIVLVELSAHPLTSGAESSLKGKCIYQSDLVTVVTIVGFASGVQCSEICCAATTH